MDEDKLRELKALWDVADADRSGELDHSEFQVVMERLARSDWVEISDPHTGRMYFYNKKTRETRWEEPESAETIGKFLVEQNVPQPSGWPSFGIQLSRCRMDNQSQLPQLLRCIRDSCQAPDAILARPLPSTYFTAAPHNDGAEVLQRRLNDGADFSVSKDLHACFYVLRQWMLQLPPPGLFEDVPSTEVEVCQCTMVAQAQQVLERRTVSGLELRVLRCVLGLLAPHINPTATAEGDGTSISPKEMACVVGPLLGLKCSAASANLFALLLLAGVKPRQADDNAKRVAELFRVIDLDSSDEISFVEFARWWAQKDESRAAVTGSRPHDVDRTVQELQKMFEMVDGDGNHSLDLSEFSQMVKHIATAEWKRTESTAGDVTYVNERTGATRRQVAGQEDTIIAAWLQDRVGNYVGTV
eukprot:COSAG01_NODE_8294_length_2840_cov_1.538854_1_plen_414_part_10